MSKAVLFFADGTEECEALLVADLLRRAKVEVIIASAMGRRALVSSHGIHLNADALAEDVDYSDVDMVILPGGIPGTPNLAENKTVTDTCVSFAKAGKKVAAICAAPPATGLAVPFLSLWSWCASWQAPPRPTASRRPSLIGTEKEAFRCASSPAVCPTA